MKLRNLSNYEGGVIVNQPNPQRPIVTPGMRIRKALMAIVTLGLFITGAFYLIFWVFTYRPVAILERPVLELGFPISGRLDNVRITEGAEIAKDQELAALDVSLIESEILEAQKALALAQSELEEKKEQLRLQEAEIKNKHEDKLLSLKVQEEELHSDAVKDKARMERLAEEVDGYRKELDRIQSLSDKGVSTGRQLDMATTNYQARKRELEQITVAVTQNEKRHENSVQRRKEWESRLVNPKQEPLLEPSVRKVTEAEAVLATARQKLEAMTLRSPFEGTVDQILSHPGESIIPGQPVMRIVGKTGGWIEAYIEEKRAEKYLPGTKVRLSCRLDGKSYLSTITSVAPTIQETPQKHLLFYTGSSVFGRRMQIALPEGCQLPSGATFELSIN